MADPIDGALRILLVVDDDLSTAAEIARILISVDYLVEFVTSADAALRPLQRQACDVLITDLVMSNISAVGLIQEISAQKLFPLSRIIVVTGEYEVSPDIRFVQSLNISVLHKPVPAEALLQVLTRILESKRNTRT